MQSTGLELHCVDHLAWNRRPIWLDSLSPSQHVRGIVALMIVGGLIAALLSLQQRLIGAGDSMTHRGKPC